MSTALPTDATERKAIPMARGLLDYFPNALAEVAVCSQKANDQHNPGEDMHWARGKSSDHADCIARHLADRGTFDTDGIRHSTKIAWRALAQLQIELEAEGAPMPRGARLATPPAEILPLERAWNEGWRCTRCGTTELWHTWSKEDVEGAGPTGPACATSSCYGDMVRE